MRGRNSTSARVGEVFGRSRRLGLAYVAGCPSPSHSSLRSHQPPWVNGTTIRTTTSAIRIGGVLISGTPGEGFPAIGDGVRDAVSDEQTVIQLGLANDQLGYLTAPLAYVPVIAAEMPVNDNIIFNVSPTVGDHVMCPDIGLALKTGFAGASPAGCAAHDAADAAGDLVGSAPVGGVALP